MKGLKPSISAIIASSWRIASISSLFSDSSRLITSTSHVWHAPLTITCLVVYSINIVWSIPPHPKQHKRNESKQPHWWNSVKARLARCNANLWNMRKYLYFKYNQCCNFYQYLSFKPVFKATWCSLRQFKN